jgi:hypothetical protein
VDAPLALQELDVYCAVVVALPPAAVRALVVLLSSHADA